jgi:DNA-binding LacI/PurR family transcriptional regulator
MPVSKTQSPSLAPRQATAHDVARIAGVSQSAVSRAFTQGASISEEMRQRVLDAAAQIGYRPNFIARSLITRRSNTIAVVAGYLQNQFYPEVLEALSQRLDRIGYRILLFPADPLGDSDPILEEILRFRVDAVLLASSSLSSRLAAECRRAGAPVILVNRTIDDPGVSSVTGDNVAGARLIAQFLAAAGHRRFGFVSGLENSSTSRDREAGFNGWLQEQGLGAPLRAVGHYQFDAAREAARTLLARRDRPDAIFCANDHTALAVIETARHEFGLQVGGDVSVVGFDDAGAASWPSFSLTTYSQPIAAMVEQVVSVLEGLLADPTAPARQQRTPGKLIVRASTRLPASGLSERDGVRTWRP